MQCYTNTSILGLIMELDRKLYHCAACHCVINIYLVHCSSSVTHYVNVLSISLRFQREELATLNSEVYNLGFFSSKCTYGEETYHLNCLLRLRC